MAKRPAVIRVTVPGPTPDPHSCTVRLIAGRLGTGRIIATRHESGNRGFEGRDEWATANADRAGFQIVHA